LLWGTNKPRTKTQQHRIGKHEEKMSDSFMSSMTFATHAFRAESIACGCDECDVNVHTPPAILETLRARKRQKLQQGKVDDRTTYLQLELIPSLSARSNVIPFSNFVAIKRSQSRTLVNRESTGVAFYKWILPREAEPLVEFGSSHRIICVERLPKDGSILTIGKGIIGSRDEEKSRTKMNWKEGGFYLVPSNGGKAIGWIYHSGDSSQQGNGHAELKIAKVPHEMLNDRKRTEPTVRFSDGDRPPCPSWAECIRDICHQVLKSQGASDDEQLCFTFDGGDVDALKASFTDAYSILS
jgi:hypothetical protein